LKQVLIRRGSPIVVNVPAPQLTANSLLVDVHCSLISTGTEVAGIAASPKSIVREAIENPSKVAKGLRMIRETGLQRTFALVNTEIDGGAQTGYSCAGVVTGVGKNVRGFAEGDRVACAGAGRANHAEIVSIPQNLAVRVPDGCDIESASSATLGAIAIQGVRRADVRLGEFVAVVGLGLIGQLTVQLLRAAGCRVIGMDVDAGRIEMAKRFGLARGINPSTEDSVRAVTEFTSGMGADAVILTASASAGNLVQQAVQMVRKKGRVVVVGAVPLELERSPFYEKEADLLISCSYGPGRYDTEYEERGLDYPYPYVRWTENRNMAEYLRLVSEKQIDFKSLIEKTWSVDKAVEAYSDLQEHRRIAVLLSFPDHAKADKKTARVEVSSKSKSPAGQIRVAIVGPGQFVRAVHLPHLKQLASSFAVTAIAGRAGPAAWNLARQYGATYATTVLADVLKDEQIDLVLIASRHDLHAKLATQALKKGKAVLLEKPAAMNEAELRELLDTAESSGRPLVIGFNRRFAPMIRNVKSLIEQRSNPLVVSYRMNAGALPADSWIQGPEGGGRIIGEACHIFDLFNFLVGTPAVGVTALPMRSNAAHVAQTDNFTASVRYEDGSLCTLTYTSLGSKDLPKEHMEVFFDGKSIVMDDFRKLSFFGISTKPITKSLQDKGHLDELRAVADHFTGKGPLPMTLDEIESATKISLAVDAIVRAGG
jgi:predicted dehydrogenase/threonine dehydrogenase-like Zn-dependent dehydrogenase